MDKQMNESPLTRIKKDEIAEVAAQVAAFKKGGGKIKKVGYIKPNNDNKFGRGSIKNG